MSIISEKTLLPLSMVFMLLGGVAWCTTLYVKTDQLTEQVRGLQMSREEQGHQLQAVQLSLARIETKLEKIYQKQ